MQSKIVFGGGKEQDRRTHIYYPPHFIKKRSILTPKGEWGWKAFVLDARNSYYLWQNSTEKNAPSTQFSSWYFHKTLLMKEAMCWFTSWCKHFIVSGPSASSKQFTYWHWSAALFYIHGCVFIKVKVGSYGRSLYILIPLWSHFLLCHLKLNYCTEVGLCSSSHTTSA